MRDTLAIFLLLLLTFSPLGNANTHNPNYDEALAKKLNADKYGMKHYVLVILKSGDNIDSNQEAKTKAFRGHLTNIKQLVEDQKLIVAGPIGENTHDFRGLFILNIDSIEAAKQLLLTDPAIAANYLKADVYPWYGSAALGEYLPISDKIWQESP